MTAEATDVNKTSKTVAARMRELLSQAQKNCSCPYGDCRTCEAIKEVLAMPADETTDGTAEELALLRAAIGQAEALFKKIERRRTTDDLPECIHAWFQLVNKRHELRDLKASERQYAGDMDENGKLR